MLIVNPHSGRGLSKTALGTIVSSLCNSDYIVTVYFTDKADPGAVVTKYAKHHDIAVCVGGDGTFSAFVSGLLRSGVTIPVGYIPAGTANDVAHTLALSRDPAAAVKAIIGGSPKPLDIGQFADRYFTYVAAFGAFTGVAYNTPQSAKRSLGHLAYLLGGIADVPTIKARRTIVEHDNGTIEDDYIFGGVINSTSVAGFVKLDPELVDLADGLFEVILVKNPVGPADFFDIISSIIKKSYSGDNVQLFHASSVKFSFEEEVAWTVDGEDGGRHKEVQIRNRHKAIELIL